MREAEKIGPATLALFEAIMRAKPHPEQGFRACLGILRLAKGYGVERLDAACGAATISALAATAPSPRSSSMASTGPTARGSHQKARRSGTATSAAVATTTEDRRKRC
jgi:hypothetical protein